MAVKNYTQSQLNNTMSGTDANAIYYATHGGTGAAPLVSTTKKSGNYATANKNGNLTYTIGGTPVPDKTPSQPTGGRTNMSDDSDYVDYDEDGSYGRSGRGGGSGSGDGGAYGYAEASSEGMDYWSMLAYMMEQQRAAAQKAYDNSRANLESAYKTTYDSLKNNLNSALGRMEENYKYGQGIQRDDANKSLQQAYINYMMNRRNLAQNLAAAGISGGATESSLANMYNNYGNSRNNINTTLAQNLRDLQNTYQNNVANANQAYNSQWAEANQNYNNYLNQLEQMLAGWQQSNYSGSNLSSLANFASTLADLTGNMNAAAGVFTPTSNNLGIDVYNTIQGNNMGSVTDYAKYLAMLEQMGA